MSVVNIAAAVGAAPPQFDAAISGWSIDSRTTQPGDCFFAIRGVRDGHDFVDKAFERGAALAIVDREISAAGPVLQTADTQEALLKLGAAAREQWGGTVIGVTGSAGKTSTKDAVAALLTTAFKTGRNEGNLNNHIGVPLSILRLDAAASRSPRNGHEPCGRNPDAGPDGPARHRRRDQRGLRAHENFEDAIDGVAAPSAN